MSNPLNTVILEGGQLAIPHRQTKSGMRSYEFIFADGGRRDATEKEIEIYFNQNADTLFKMKTQLEVYVPKEHTSRVLRLLEETLAELGEHLIPFRRGSIDNPHDHDCLVWAEVPPAFDKVQQVSNLMYSKMAITTDNVVRMRKYP